MMHFTRTIEPLAIVLVTLLGGLMLGTVAGAEPTPEPDPAQSPPAERVGADDADLLRGPSVAESVAPATLVQRGFDGELVRLEERPEIAALRLLELDEPSRAAVDAIVLERSVRASELAGEHARLVLGIRSTLASQDRRAIARLMREVRSAFEPLMEPRFRDVLAEALPAEPRAEFVRMVDEYVEALAAEPMEWAGGMMGRRGRGMDGERSRRFGGMETRRVELQLTMAEVLLAYRATIEEAQAMGDAFYEAIDATPEQRSRIQSLFMARSPLSGDEANATRESRRALIAEVYALLKPEQRRKAAAYFRDSGMRGR